MNKVFMGLAAIVVILSVFTRIFWNDDPTVVRSPTPRAISRPTAARVTPTPEVVYIYCRDCDEVNMPINIFENSLLDRVVCRLPSFEKIEVTRLTEYKRETGNVSLVQLTGCTGWLSSRLVTR